MFAEYRFRHLHFIKKIYLLATMCQAGTVPHAGDILNAMDMVLAIVNLTI